LYVNAIIWCYKPIIVIVVADITAAAVVAFLFLPGTELICLYTVLFWANKSDLTLLVGLQEGRPACKNRPTAWATFEALDLWTGANPGKPGKWFLKSVVLTILRGISGCIVLKVQ